MSNDKQKQATPALAVVPGSVWVNRSRPNIRIALVGKRGGQGRTMWHYENGGRMDLISQIELYTNWKRE